jgi:hypothetical protein
VIFCGFIETKLSMMELQHFQAWHSSFTILEDTWIPPPINWVKINFDTAIRDSLAQAAICQDDKGQIIHATSQISNSYSPNEGEAMATQLAISLAKSLNMDHFIIEGDFEVVAPSLNNPNLIIYSRISSLILDSLDSIPSAFFWEARKISKSANFYAHSMACWVAIGSHSGSIFLSSIPFIFSSSSSVILHFLALRSSFGLCGFTMC